jgi:3-methyladenine DNA glycosylase AlkC
MEDPLDLLDQLDLTDQVQEADLPEQAADIDMLEQAEAAEQNEEDAAQQGVEPPKRPSIFISHKRDVDLDDSIAARLAQDLSGLCEDIYLDTEMHLGVEYEKVIVDKLKDADFVIALISKSANSSEWVKTELQYADHFNKEQGHPVIIPVRMGYTELYDPLINVYLNRFNAIFWDCKSYAKLLKQLESTLRNEPQSVREVSITELENSRVRESRKARISEAFVEPAKPVIKDDLFEKTRLLWVIGDPGARNYFAQGLAASRVGKERIDSIYDVSKSQSWQELSNTGVRNAIIVLRDALPASHFSEDTSGDELSGLSSLIERDNIVIATAPKDAFLDAEQEMFKWDFNSYKIIEITHDSYDYKAKLKIFENLLEASLRSGNLEEKQYGWASSLLRDAAEDRSLNVGETKSRLSKATESLREENRDRFHSVIEKWSPADIERFIVSLRQAKKLGDIAKLLQRNASLDELIHSWFVSLDDSTKCFVLTLALFSELKKEQFWDKYKNIVTDLHKMDPQLRLLPLGICRHHTQPYVLSDGSIDFIDERVSETICQEIAQNYREYFIELIPSLKRWSVPPQAGGNKIEDKEERKRKIDDTREVRTAIARMTGKLGRLGLDDLLDLLDYWATDFNNPIREAAALALEQAAFDVAGGNYALSLLEQWCSDSSNNRAPKRTWTAALALGSIAAATPGSTTSSKALNHLRRLTEDNRHRVRDFVALALRKMARKISLAEIENILIGLAEDKKPFVRINVAEALNEARLRDEQSTLEVLKRWESSGSASLCSAVICSLIIRRKSPARRASEISSFMAENVATVAVAFIETIADEHYREAALSVLEQLVVELPRDVKGELVYAFAGVSANQLEEELLPFLREAGRPYLANLSVEIRREVWKQLSLNPADLLKAINKALNQKQAVKEVYITLSWLLQPEPGGKRQQIVSAMADCYLQDRKPLEGCLRKLEEIAPAIFEPVSVEIRREAYKKALDYPSDFVRYVTEDLVSDQIFDEAVEALESLAADDPEGNRQQLLEALAYAYLENPDQVKYLLKTLRGVDSQALNNLAYEFNYRFLESNLSESSLFLARIKESMQENAEWQEMLGILQYLAAPEPHGKRRAVVRTLTEARSAHPLDVDVLLQDPSLTNWSNLATLQSEVKRASIIGKIFGPKILTRVFAPKY